MRSSNKIIILLVSLNLAATVFFGIVNHLSMKPPKPFEKPVIQELPDFISTKIKNDILDRFIMHFNAEDYEGLYNMLGPNARAEFSQQEKATEFARFSKFFHSIKQGAFSNFQFVGRQGDSTLYALIYSVELSEHSELGNRGKLKVTIEVADDAVNTNYQIYSLYLHANGN